MNARNTNRTQKLSDLDLRIIVNMNATTVTRDSVILMAEELIQRRKAANTDLVQSRLTYLQMQIQNFGMAKGAVPEWDRWQWAKAVLEGTLPITEVPT